MVRISISYEKFISIVKNILEGINCPFFPGVDKIGILNPFAGPLPTREQVILVVIRSLKI